MNVQGLYEEMVANEKKCHELRVELSHSVTRLRRGNKILKASRERWLLAVEVEKGRKAWDQMHGPQKEIA